MEFLSTFWIKDFTWRFLLRSFPSTVSPSPILRYHPESMSWIRATVLEELFRIGRGAVSVRTGAGSKISLGSLWALLNSTLMNRLLQTRNSGYFLIYKQRFVRKARRRREKIAVWGILNSDLQWEFANPYSPNWPNYWSLFPKIRTFFLLIPFKHGNTPPPPTPPRHASFREILGNKIVCFCY